MAVMRIFTEAANSGAEAPRVLTAIGSLASMVRYQEALAGQFTLGGKAIEAHVRSFRVTRDITIIPAVISFITR